MLEVLILAVSAQAAARTAPAQVPEQAPPAELLEFLGDWSDQDAEMLDENPGPPGARPGRLRAHETRNETNDDTRRDAQADR